MLLQDKQVGAIVIATPPQTHYSLAKKALQHNKHVLVEKPMTLKSQECEELSDIARANNSKLSVGHIFLYNDGVNFLKKQISAPEFGKIHEIECIRQGHGPIRTEINVLWDLATHDISILLYLLDQMPTTVTATGFKYAKNSLQEDSVVLCLNFPNNVNSIVKANWQYPIKERRVTVIGENKMVRFSDTDISAPITIYDKSVLRHGEQSEADYGAFKMIVKDGGYYVPCVKVKEPLLMQMSDFLGAISKNQEPLSNSLYGVNVVRVLEAAQKSLENNGMLVGVKNE